MSEAPREVGLVSCTKSKLNEPARPRELYQPSAFFAKASRYTERAHDEWYVLSAKHHVLDPDGPPIEPYDETLSGASRDRKRAWSRTIRDDLEARELLEPGTTLVFHAGRDYYEELVPLLEGREVRCKAPTEGLRFGETLSWYNDRLCALDGEDNRSTG